MHDRPAKAEQGSVDQPRPGEKEGSSPSGDCCEAGRAVGASSGGESADTKGGAREPKGGAEEKRRERDAYQDNAAMVLERPGKGGEADDEEEGCRSD
jgi:hypothetical protein